MPFSCLDCVSRFAGLFNNRNKLAALLILFILMLLPTVFSIAQPLENPSLGRAIGAAIPAFLIAGRGFSFAADRFWNSENESQLVRRAIFVGIFGSLLIIRNFGLINSTYARNYSNSAWNATEIAEVIKNYNTGQAGSSQAYVVGFPHWVDARSVAISMDEPNLNLSILPRSGNTLICRLPRSFCYTSMTLRA